jgi:hypothetical protein
MKDMTSQEQSYRRLRILLSHVIGHAECHMNEIHEERLILDADTALSASLDKALHDMEAARLSVAAFLHELDHATGQGHSHGDDHHGHSHGS